MPWVVMTPFGSPVEPDVNRIFATVSGPTAAAAASTAPVGRVARSVANGVVALSRRLPSSVTISMQGATVAAAGPCCAAPSIITRAGCSTARQCRSFEKLAPVRV